ncbi:tRNA-uridine aminocarboxypropyltransferase [Colwellia sp. MEBiC06753]
MLNAVQQLYRHRKQLSTKPFNARGKKVNRCEFCQLAKANCICALKQSSMANSAFCLLMHDAEVLKPSNTARLIADIVPSTYAFIWSRTEPPSGLLALLSDPHYLPLVVFPKQYAAPSQQVFENNLPDELITDKTPLFILLDGSWREAKKMFRKSPYLVNFPVVSFSDESNQVKAHYIRDAQVENQLATAQVAAKILAFSGDKLAGKHLSLWFDLFNFNYQKSVCQLNKGRQDALARYQHFIDKEVK